MVSPSRVFAALQPVIRKLASGETLFAVGDAAHGFFEVRSGRIKLVRFGVGGRETLLFMAGPGEHFAEASFFTEIYHCDAVAVSDCTVACFPKATALAMLRADMDARLDLTADLARQVMRLREALTLRDIRSARERVFTFLAAKAGPDGCTVAIEGPLKDVAAAIGLTPEAFYRALAQLDSEGAIRRRVGSITLT